MPLLIPPTSFVSDETCFSSAGYSSTCFSNTKDSIPESLSSLDLCSFIDIVAFRHDILRTLPEHAQYRIALQSRVILAAANVGKEKQSLQNTKHVLSKKKVI